MTPNGVPFPRDEQPSPGPGTPQPPLLTPASYLTHPAPARRRRGGLLMASIGALVMLLLIGLVAVILGLGKDPGPSAPPTDPITGEPGWDLAAETALATRPMPQLPEEAAKPHALSTRTPLGFITLPPPGGNNGIMPVQFPPTPEGALAQLAALTRVGSQGADPQAYELAYNSIAAPGAPQVDSTGIHRTLADARRAARLPQQGSVNSLSLTFTPLAGLIKGTTDGGRYAVVCVLGQVDANANGVPFSGGGGDCQAMRWNGRTWQIAPGAAAAAGPVAWPGSDEAFDAGYLPLRTP
ncbi:hypothetical protein Psed_6748 (plasmid) [Pseudonocardia dioxanivorans CB1190]|uniref:Uncharacterized protein n=1 Tax=Pseudonocardia dioxanivorans (strain ATCC 55486 / DSM 44775 / JCM 13855 / CB1190) TaxID=675635 RepID=F2L6V7_PSEUX|nr:hypothetical protein [Pseudonocardia dioxanivorans]AEA28829.1 hypothetical protein Psed_6748 [Pseudonocardia dioxanivorans CB1190]GJF01679.1 hypothetical protein PSD17_06430 [Pseudonocardia sp. D17]